MWRRQKFPMIHEPVRRWRHPFAQVCACGIGAWPSTVKTMLDRHAQKIRRGNTGPAWDEATSWVPPVRPPLPLLTPGQAARSRLGEHRWTGPR
jgi:hypothetical protein